MDASPFHNRTSPLRFRGIPDSLAKYHLEASECCLIHTDNYLTASKGVWVNPNVRVAYNVDAYDAVHQQRSWISTSEFLRGVWENRLRRWTTTTWLKRTVVNYRLRKWAKADKHHVERGTHCLTNEMQVLIWNGWAHV